MRDHESLKCEALAIWHAGVVAADAERLTEQTIGLHGRQLHIGQTSVDLDFIDRIAVVGGGKASGWMARGLLGAFGPEWVSDKVAGWINVPNDQVIDCGPINIFGARRPAENVATEAVLLGTEKILEIARALTARDLCICLISGGGSALLEQPLAPLGLADIRELTKVCSANKTIDIKQLNTIRKKLSHIKGGGLAIAAYPAKTVSLILSDIIGDPVDLIASGPTVEDRQTVDEAIEILSRLKLERNRFASTWDLLLRMKTSSLKPPWPAACLVDNQIIGNNQTAIEGARIKAAELGYETRVSNADPTDNRTADETGRDLAKDVLSLAGTQKPICLISGGEPTVELSDTPGRGGRNQQLILKALIELVDDRTIKGNARFCILSGGTDGEDGNVPVAGAAIDQATVERVIELEMLETAIEALRINDAYSCLEALDCTIKLNPTKTNVCDLRIVVVR